MNFKLKACLNFELVIVPHFFCSSPSSAICNFRNSRSIEIRYMFYLLMNTQKKWVRLHHELFEA